MIANADMVEAYIWTPSNSAEVIVWANHVRSLADHTATLTLRGEDATLTPGLRGDLTLDCKPDTQNIYTWTNPGGDLRRLVGSDSTPITSGSDYNIIKASMPRVSPRSAMTAHDSAVLCPLGG